MKTTIKLNLKNLNLDLFSYCTYIWLLLKNVFNLYPDIDKKEKLKKNFIIVPTCSASRINRQCAARIRIYPVDSAIHPSYNRP